MKKIRFESMHGMQEVRIPAVGEMIFQNGETKEVSDQDAAVLLSNPQFVDVDSGKNPNFRCAVCGAITLSDGFVSPRLEVIPYRDAEDRRICANHFVDGHPQWREWHEIMSRRAHNGYVEIPEPRNVFTDIALAPIDLTPALQPARASFSIGENVAEGQCTIGFDDDLKPYATCETDLTSHLTVKRRFEPGRIVSDDCVATIEPAAGTWRAFGAIAETQGERHSRDEPSTGMIVARIGELVISGAGLDLTAQHVRWIVRGSAAEGIWRWRGN